MADLFAELAIGAGVVFEDFERGFKMNCFVEGDSQAVLVRVGRKTTRGLKGQ